MVVGVFHSPGYNDPVTKLGCSDTTQKSLVGIADSYESAMKLVGKDYLEIVVNEELNPAEHPLVGNPSHSEETPAYIMGKYSWYFIQIQPNTVINLAI